ncbi:peptidase, M28 family [Leptospira weilii str. Ecochallenge]|uniref:Peptidase, M28 family n=1 Tax=Leptospira weilii str. Ecochallenge TaxID=1049986 RepID=N1UDC0_9LEPT|nr:peptidase, M28 family [Leptospira weilii str. Ecochallenge]
MHSSVFKYKNHIDGIYRHIIALCEFDRLPGSPEYDLALDYVISELKIKIAS